MRPASVPPPCPTEILRKPAGRCRQRRDTQRIRCHPLVGHVLKGTYRLDGQIGGGAMGLVFRGVHLHLRKAVAIKLLSMLPDGDDAGVSAQEALQRFEREARLGSLFTHPNIAQVFDYGVADGTPYLVMELCEGEDLSTVLRREGPLPPLRALGVLRQLLLALAHMHRHGVIHRDIKPQNIRLLRSASGGPMILKLLDFGLARSLHASRREAMTLPGLILGTPKYLAPEQIGRALRDVVPEQERRVDPDIGGPDVPVDGRADLYAAGVVFYELLTGSPPFSGPMVEVLRAHLDTQPVPLPPSIPASVRDIAGRLLDKRPERRFRDADAALAALDECEESFCASTEIFLRIDPEPEPEPPSRRRVPLRRRGHGGVLLCGVLLWSMLLASLAGRLLGHL